jgi:hypothetical protein
MREWFAEVRFAARQLFRNPGFVLFAVAALALAIGANKAVFSAVNALLPIVALESA